MSEFTKHLGVLASAIDFATHAHEGQTRRDGITPYIVHPVQVMGLVRAGGLPEHLQAVAALHDVLEDTTTSVKDMRDAEIPDFVIETVEKLTKRKEESYQEYIRRVASDEDAAKVKMCDIFSNLMDQPSDHQVEKYMKAIPHLVRRKAQ